ncbi:protein kinase domain-containing protein [Nocardia sp. NPDC003693]
MQGTPFGRYRLLELLGEGGMGQVYRAYDTGTDRMVALKVLPPGYAHDEKYRARFRREAQAAARLSEPHVVPIHDYGEIDGRLFLDMRSVDGSDLAHLLDRSGALTPARAVSIIGQIAAALDAAHGVNLVHRDVKPSNILVTPEDFAYLIDFGIARGSDETSLTTTGATVGTLAYMAPERFSKGVYDASSDVYSLACVLYECLTGAKPFPGPSAERQIAGHLTEPPPKPSVTAAGVPSGFDAVIAWGMAKDPAQRCPSAGALAAAARDVPTASAPPAPVFPPPTPPSAPQPTTVVSDIAAYAEMPATQVNPAGQRFPTTPEGGAAQQGSPGHESPARGGYPAAGAGPVPPAYPPARDPEPGYARAQGDSQPPSAKSKSWLDPRLVWAMASVLVVALGVTVVYGVLSASRKDSADHNAAPGSYSPDVTAPVTPGPLPGTSVQPPTAQPSSAPTTPPATKMTDFVREHYALLPANTRAAYDRLSPDYQRRIGGYDAYRSFWDTISSVETDAVTADPDTQRVTYRLTLTADSGQVTTEWRVIQLAQVGTSYYIISAELR